jgi:hypothetical protein
MSVWGARCLAAAAVSVLSACVVTAHAPPPRGILVSGPPPAVIAEEPGPAPAGHAAWVAGYWHWTGIQYAWIPGHWDAAPPTGTVWRAPAYVQNNGAYFYEPGGWRPQTSAVSAPATPPPNAEAFH